MSTLKKIRRIRDHAATIAGMCRRIEKDFEEGKDINEKLIRAIESRLYGLLRETGVRVE